MNQTTNNTLNDLSEDKKLICILHTGGTIGMKKNENGYEPCNGYLKKLLKKMPEIDSAMEPIPNHELIEFKKLLDSSAMEPDDWYKIAKAITDRKGQYSGFVVLHGTDTMAYTASALSFLLGDLDCPVIITGSQIPLMEPRNDAREHLITAMILAAHSKFHEVCLYFRGKLMRGNRTTKIDADGLEGFDSPNCLPLLNVGVRLDITKDLMNGSSLTIKSGDSIPLKPIKKYPIACIRLYPGFDPLLLQNIVPDDEHAFGLILECFGAGNGPEDRLKEPLEALIKKGVVVVNVTQCLKGTVNLKLYAAGSWMEKICVASGLDMTPEAAMTKLLYLFQKYNRRSDAPKVRKEMMQNLRNELTEPEE